MELDLNVLLKQYRTLKAEYSSLEEAELNLFNHLSNIVNLDWKDGNSILFSKIIDTERGETDQFRIVLLNKISVFEFIYSRYCGLGKKIRCDLEKKEVVLSAIDRAISKLDSVNGIFSSMNLSLGFPEFYTLQGMRQTYSNMRNELADIRSHLVSLYTKIENIENDIGSKIRSLDLFKTNPIIYSLTGNVTSAQLGNLFENEFAIDLEKYELSIDEENTKAMKIHETMEQTQNCYKSKNSPLIQAMINDYKNNVDQLHDKRVNCNIVLHDIPPLYGLTIEHTKKVYEEAEF